MLAYYKEAMQHADVFLFQTWITLRCCLLWRGVWKCITVNVNQEDDEADELHDSVTEKLDVFGDEDIGWVDEEVVGSTVYLDSVSVSSCT